MLFLDNSFVWIIKIAHTEQQNRIGVLGLHLAILAGQRRGLAHHLGGGLLLLGCCARLLRLRLARLHLGHQLVIDGLRDHCASALSKDESVT